MSDTQKHDMRPDAEKSAAELARETKDAAAERAAELKDKAKDVARDAYETGKAEAQARADGAKRSAADETSRTAQAMRDAASRFPEGDVRAQLATQFADGLNSIADRIRDKDLGDIPGDITAFARKNPGVFFAGAAALGFVVARMAKASQKDHPHQSTGDLLSHSDGSGNAFDTDSERTQTGHPPAAPHISGGAV